MDSSNIKYVLGVDGLVNYQLLGFIVKAKLAKEKTNFRQSKKLACLGTLSCRSNNNRAWKLSLLTSQQEKSWKAETFLGLTRKLRFQGKSPPWIWRDKWPQIVKVKISLPEQKPPEPEPGRNSRIIMLINCWGCMWTNRRVGLPWGLLSWEQGADVLWFYLQEPHQVVKCQEKNHLTSRQVDKESNHFEIFPEYSPLHRTDYTPVKKAFQSLISSWERALKKKNTGIYLI